MPSDSTILNLRQPLPNRNCIDDLPAALASSAGIPQNDVSFVRDTYRFNFPSTPSRFVDDFRRYYGPTMNAFEAAEKSGRAHDLRNELEALFETQNTSPGKDLTSIPATFLRVTVAVN